MGREEISDLFPWSLLIHFFCEVVRPGETLQEVGCSCDAIFCGSSAGRAAAVLVKALRTRNASMGEKSNVPPRGGMIPRNIFKYGSQIVLDEQEKNNRL